MEITATFTPPRIVSIAAVTDISRPREVALTGVDVGDDEDPGAQSDQHGLQPGRTSSEERGEQRSEHATSWSPSFARRRSCQ